MDIGESGAPRRGDTLTTLSAKKLSEMLPQECIDLLLDQYLKANPAQCWYTIYDSMISEVYRYRPKKTDHGTHLYPAALYPVTLDLSYDCEFLYCAYFERGTLVLYASNNPHLMDKYLLTLDYDDRRLALLPVKGKVTDLLHHGEISISSTIISQTPEHHEQLGAKWEDSYHRTFNYYEWGVWYNEEC